jgi:hypothetical protein
MAGVRVLSSDRALRRLQISFAGSGVLAVGACLAAMLLAQPESWKRIDESCSAAQNSTWDDCDGVCRGQLAKRREACAQIQRDLEVAAQRIRTLETALLDTRISGWIDARRELSQERAHQATLERQQRDLTVGHKGTQAWYTSGCWYLVFIVAGLLLEALVFRWALRGAREACILKAKGPTWSYRVYLVTGLMFFVPHLFEQVLTSVVASDKSLFGWESYCVSRGSFIALRVAMLGVSFALALPYTVLYELLDRKWLPQLALLHKDGACGAGPYVAFLRLWSFVGLGLVALVFVSWLKYLVWTQANFNPRYLITPLFYLTVAAWVLARALLAAYGLRLRYHEAVAVAMQDIWSAEKLKTFPPDPTLAFLPEKPWQLPASVLAVLVGLWWVLDQLGLKDLVSHLLQ